MDRKQLFAEFRRKLEAASVAQLAGQSDAFIGLWSQKPDCFLFGALGGYERGIAEIDPRLRWAASQVKSTNHRFENLRSEINGDWALTADLEHTRRWIDGRPEERTLRITHVCRFEDGEWRIFYRHADVYRPPAR